VVIRRAICTFGIGPHVDLLAITVPPLRSYAVRHGYDLVVRTEVSGLTRPPSWAKVVLLRELLDTYDVVVWIDADAIVVDPTGDIAPGVPRRPMSLVSHVIDGVPVPNCGVMVLRRGPDALSLLGRMWRRVELIDHRWWENAALIAELGGDTERGLVDRRSRFTAARRLGRLDHRWNSIPSCPASHPAIVHLAGVSHEERLRVLADLAGRSAPAA
jgi:hypothetical protein